MNENVHPSCLTGKMLLNGMDRGLGTGESKTELRHDHAILMGHERQQLGQWWRELMQKMERERRTIIREFLNIMLRLQKDSSIALSNIRLYLDYHH